MTYYELGYDLKKIHTATILKKSNGLLLPALILFPTVFIIFLVFLGLYISQVPIEVNDIVRTFNEPEYQDFFTMFLTIIGTVSIIHVFLLVTLIVRKPKECLYLATGIDNEPIMYSINRKKLVYIDESQMLTLYSSSSAVERTTDPVAIKREKNSILFWTGLENIKDFKIKKSINKIKLTYADPYVSERKTYTLIFDESGNLNKYREFIMYKNYGNQQFKGMNTYYIDNINQNQRLPINPLIKAKLSEYTR